MALSILSDTEGRTAGSALFQALQEALRGQSGATVLVPSSRAALELRRELADAGVGLGVDVLTPWAWASGVWQRGGNGLRPATDAQARAAAWKVLGGAEHGSARGDGALVARLAMEASEALDPRARGLSVEQAAAVEAAAAVAGLLESRGLLTRSSLLERVPSLCSQASPPGALIIAGLWSAEPSLVRLVGRLAARRDVTYVLSAPEGPAGDASRLAAEVFARDAQANGAQVLSRAADTRRPTPPGRAGELQSLLDAAFGGEEMPAAGQTSGPGAPVPPVAPTGAVRLLEAAGPEAEAELLAVEVQRLADGGAEQVVVVTEDPERAWRELSPKLASRGMQVRASWSRPGAELRQVRLFLAFARQVGALAQASRDWARPLRPLGADEPLDDALEQALSQSVGADRSWWPPRALSDYLTAGPVGLPRGRAFLLDARWRSSRTLEPGDVLRDLHEAAGAESPLARCVDALCAGRLGEGAEALLPWAAEHREREAHQALLAVASASQEADLLLGASVQGLDARLEVVECMLEATKLRRSPERGRLGDTLRCIVELLGPQDAAALPPASVDAVVLTGQTAAQSRVASPRGAFQGLLAAMGLTQPVPEEARARHRAWRTWAAPTHALLAERSLHDESAEPTQPAPMLAELLACYQEELPVAARGEERVSQNLSAKGRAPEPVAEEPELPGASIERGHAALVLARPDLEGAPDGLGPALEDGSPILSATAIESYLECPRRWFHEKALRPAELDAGLTPLAKGNLVHRALEVAHRRGRAARAQGADPCMPDLLDQAFDRLVLDGLAGMGEGAAVAPHSMADEETLRSLRRNLEAVAQFEGERFRGFSPYMLEASFGTEGGPVVYGGARLVGLVDRVDVDREGHALVVDYKNKQDMRAFGEYGLPRDPGPLATWRPRHVQALIYAQVVRRMFPDLDPVGAVYLMTGAHQDMRGLVDDRYFDAVFGQSSPLRRTQSVAGTLGATFHEALDRTEEVVAEAIAAMTAGDVAPRPCDPRLCEGCPVVGCERRRAAR